MTRNSSRPLTALFVEDNEDGTVGGSHVCLRNLVLHLDPQVVRPVVLFYQTNRIAEQLRDAGVETHVWTSERERERLPLGRGWLRNPRLALRLAGAVRRRMRFLGARRIDVVHLNNNFGLGFDDWLPAARLTGRPCIAHVRGYQPAPERWIWDYLQRHFDHYVPVSATIESDMRRRGFDLRNSTVIFDAIDEADMLARVRTAPAEVRQELGVGQDQLLAVMAGHIRDWKGQDAILRGVALLAPEVRARLVVAFAGGVGRGSEAYFAGLQAFVAEHRLDRSVRFLGERQDVPDLLNAADLVLHGSTTPEPFGLVVLEGMLFGKLVLASNRGGPAEIIRPGTGVLFDPDDAAGLARELTRAIVDEGARTAVAQAARTRAREFGPISRTAREVEALYRKLPRLRGRRGTPASG